jgi:3-deoxy-manno-octulosonate cytidylyltransferase (CMP-KDO synthetase)
MSRLQVLGIIPARYASTRFPGKPLVKIGNKTMIERVYSRAIMADCFDHVLVATDDQRIFQHVNSFGGNVLLTSGMHETGTDRCIEALELYESQKGTTPDVIVNIQGDEPFVEPEVLKSLVQVFQLENTVQIATLATKFSNFEDIQNPNRIKIVCDLYQNALYFSRSVIPFPFKSNELSNYLKHIGVYAFKSDILKKIKELKPTLLEKIESLEQLRWMQNGLKIKVVFTEYNSINIDTPEDLENILNVYKDQLND